MIEFVKQLYQLQEEDLIKGGRYHNLNDFMKFPNPVAPNLEEKPMPALENGDLENKPSILDNIANQDQILHFPYQSYDYVLRFF